LRKDLVDFIRMTLEQGAFMDDIFAVRIKDAHNMISGAL